MQRPQVKTSERDWRQCSTSSARRDHGPASRSLVMLRGPDADSHLRPGRTVIKRYRHLICVSDTQDGQHPSGVGPQVTRHPLWLARRRASGPRLGAPPRPSRTEAPPTMHCRTRRLVRPGGAVVPYAVRARRRRTGTPCGHSGRTPSSASLEPLQPHRRAGSTGSRRFSTMSFALRDDLVFQHCFMLGFLMGD